MRTSFTVTIVIPNWNGKHLLEKNLPYVIASVGSAEIIVADDASSDDSVEFLKRVYPDIIVVESTKQRGFAGNVNNGVSKATGDIVILLNSDVRPEKEFLVPLLSHFTDVRVSAVGCLEKSHERKHVVLRGRGRARWERGYFVHSRGDTDREDTAWVSGGSSAYRRSVWEELGGMDSLYNPFYWEDIDFSYQMLKSGYIIRFEKRSIVNHFHEEGKIKTSYAPHEVKRIVYRNQFIFLWKNMSDTSIVLSHFFWTPIRLFQAVLRGDTMMLQGYIMALLKLIDIVKSRNIAAKHWKRADCELFAS